MKVGVIVPQGWTGEYHGWESQQAWRKTVEIAQRAEELGFESVWMFDHFHTTPDPTDELTFESYASISALAALTRRVRLGHIVTCTAFRNPALTAKMISTLDTISDGRMELGIGAGWKKEEWLAYGYHYPETRERLAVLADHLEVISRMLAPGRATYEGRHARVAGAINLPKPVQQPRTPIMVGGNGQSVTWRLAARHADELNVDAMPPDDLAAALPTLRARCEEIGRDPDSLRVSVHVWWQQLDASTDERVALLRDYRELGVSRVMALVRDAVSDDAALERFADDARTAGAELAGVAA